MPELPEVEAARRAIEHQCIGRKIQRSVIADDSKVIDGGGLSRSDFEASLLGKTIVATHRKGKNMWLELDSPPFPSFQFGMSGAIYIKGVAVTKYKRSAVNDIDEWPSKYSKLFIELDDGLELSFTDKRRFAKVRLLNNPASVPPISELGPDALLEPMTADEFYSSLSKKKIGIKALLLDQSYISGIGNWIADEVLYQARIHPLQSAASMSKESCATLNKCIKEVIEQAVEVGADSSQFPTNWIFHNREKKHGKAFVDGKKIEFITAGGRTTAYVPELQKLIGSQAAKAPGKPQKGTIRKKNTGSSDDDADEPSEEEENARVDSKEGRSSARREGKQPPSKRKSSGNVGDKSDDDSNHDDQEQIKGLKKPLVRGKSKDSKKDNEDQSKKPRVKKPAAKRKSDGNDDSGDEDYDDDDDNSDGVEKKAMKGKQHNVEKKTKKKVETSGNGKQQRKRAK